MDLGRWVLLLAVVGALAFGGGRALTDGRFRGTRRVRGFETGAERPPQPAVGQRPPQPAVEPAVGALASLLAGTSYDGRRGDRATLLQFSSAFCAPCRATRRILANVADTLPGVTHVEVDAESHLDLVRRLGILRTPTTLVLDPDGREVARATGAPRIEQVRAALEASIR